MSLKNPATPPRIDAGTLRLVTVFILLVGFILSDKCYLPLAVAITPRVCAIRETGHVNKINEPKGSDKYHVSDTRVKCTLHCIWNLLLLAAGTAHSLSADILSQLALFTLYIIHSLSARDAI